MKNKFPLCVKKKKNSGLTLIELLMYVTLMGIIAPIITMMFMYGYNSYKSNYNLIKQEDMVSNTTHMIRNDIEYASEINIYSGNKKMEIKFPASSGKEDKLWVIDDTDNTIKVGNSSGSGTFAAGSKISIVAENVDTSQTKFENIPSGATGYNTIAFTLQPEKLNQKKNANRDFLKPIITEISVRYKTVNLIP